MSSTSSRKSTREERNPFAIAAIGMIIALPFTRILEAILRLAFMHDYYGSVRESLTKDLWFSEGWLTYVKTPLGLSMTLLPLVLIFGAVGSFFLAIRWHRKRLPQKDPGDS